MSKYLFIATKRFPLEVYVDLTDSYGADFILCLSEISTRFEAILSTTKVEYSLFLLMFNSWHLPFSNVPYSPFQKNETLESWHN